jgi:hypothetical protein
MLNLLAQGALALPCSYTASKNLDKISNSIFANKPSLQVLRYSALGAGIFYGLYHQAKLSTATKLAAVNKEYENKQRLIDQAKAEYTKKNLPPSAKSEGEDGTFASILFHRAAECTSRSAIAVDCLDIS